jgi:hypothetical protein
MTHAVDRAQRVTWLTAAVRVARKTHPGEPGRACTRADAGGGGGKQKLTPGRDFSGFQA